MADTLHAYDYTIIGVVLCLFAIMGIYSYFENFKQNTLNEFLMGEKNASLLPVTFSLFATMTSAIFMLGAPAETYMYGMQYSTSILILPISVMLSYEMFLPVYFEMELSSIYEYLSRRFGKLIRTIISLMFVFQTLCYSAVALYTPAMALNVVTNFSTWSCVSTLMLVCVFYSSMGGLKTIMWTDLIQTFFMFITLFSVFIKGTIKVGGFAKSIEIANKGKRLQFFNPNFNLNERYTLWNTLCQEFFLRIAAYGTSQLMMQRVLNVRTLKRAKRAFMFNIPVHIIFSCFCFWNGIVLYSLYYECDPILDPNASLSSPDQLIPNTILQLYEEWPGFSGICIVGILSASLSTVSSALNSITTVIIEDLIRPFFPYEKTKNLLTELVAKIIVICVGILCMMVTVIVANFQGVLEASLSLLGITCGPILSVYCLGMFTLSANEEGAVIGLLTSFALFAWITFGSFLSNVTESSLPRSIEGCKELNQTLDNRTTFHQYHVDYEKEDLEKNIFPLYKISFMWYTTFATVTAFIIGYISSNIIDCFREKKKLVKEELISPPLRKWLF